MHTYAWKIHISIIAEIRYHRRYSPVEIDDEVKKPDDREGSPPSSYKKSTKFNPGPLIWRVLVQFSGSGLCLHMFNIFLTVSFIGPYVCYDIYNSALC